MAAPRLLPFRTELVVRLQLRVRRPLGRGAWTRAGSGFTLLFEALVLAMAPAMRWRSSPPWVDEHDTRLWRLVRRQVDEARARRSDRAVRSICIDEASSRRGHDYITLFVNLDRSRLLFAAPGKDASTVLRFREDFVVHGSNPAQLEEACCDKSTGLIKGLPDTFPDVPTKFDRFHLMQ